MATPGGVVAELVLEEELPEVLPDALLDVELPEDGALEALLAAALLVGAAEAAGDEPPPLEQADNISELANMPSPIIPLRMIPA
jgi:hypothetical protein